MLDDYLYSNIYYQKKVNLDPERCQKNLERAILRKHRELEVRIVCDHNKEDWCQIRNISHEELENFHDRYWSCVGTVKKRVFVAKYLTVEAVYHKDCKRDLNITCHCPKKDGTKIVVCQKSFISVLGVSKHKVLAIGKAKLSNSEQLYKETRGGKRKRNIEKNLLKYSKKSRNEHNTIDNNQDSESEETDHSQGNEKIFESIIDTGVLEPEINVNESLNETNSNNNDSNDSDIEICSPVIPTVHIDESDSTISDDDDNDKRVEVLKPNSPIKTESISSPLSSYNSFQSDKRNEIYIRKKTQQPFPHLLRQFNTKTTGTSVSAVVRSQKYELVKIDITNDKHLPQQKKNVIQEISRQSTSSSVPSTFYSAQNIESDLRGLQTEKENLISCTHNSGRFCKILSIPKSDLVKFHEEFWRCSNVVSERLFLARYIIVTPISDGREMTIIHRIPSSDGNIYEVCQKSFLSVVGISKFKVESVAKAILCGELLKDDEPDSSNKQNTTEFRRNTTDGLNNNNNYQSKDYTLKIAEVISNYKPNMNGEFNVEIKSEPAIEIQESNDNSDITSFKQEDIIITDDDANEKGNNKIDLIENYHNKKISVNISEPNYLNYKNIKENLIYYKRKSERLLREKKKLCRIINVLKMENIRLKSIKKNE